MQYQCCFCSSQGVRIRPCAKGTHSPSAAPSRVGGETRGRCATMEKQNKMNSQSARLNGVSLCSMLSAHCIIVTSMCILPRAVETYCDSLRRMAAARTATGRPGKQQYHKKSAAPRRRTLKATLFLLSMCESILSIADRSALRRLCWSLLLQSCLLPGCFAPL